MNAKGTALRRPGGDVGASLRAQRASARGRAPAVAILAPLVVALLAGLGSGLVRLGVEVPAASRLLAVNHGALMVGGVVGTVIGVERAVAMGRPAAYAGPALSVAGAIVLVADSSTRIAPALFAGSAAAVTLLFLAFLRRQVALPLAVMTTGAACWLAGNLVWLLDGWTPRSIVPWWIAFLALTIAGERLELTRFMPLRSATRIVLWAALAMLIAGPTIALAGRPAGGIVLCGLGTTVMGCWLAGNDTARRTFRRGGVATYAGCALLAAYAWLGLSGIALATWTLEPGLHYDTTLHSFFLGFVFGAIFAHAPIILPAVTGLTLRFTPIFTAGLVTLHASLAIRVGANLAEEAAWRRVGGTLNVAAVLLLGAAVAVGLWLGRSAHAEKDGRDA